MATKNNNRNIRISDRMLLLIEQQTGNNFTEKWEMLVTRCAWELPEKEKQLKELDKQIRKKATNDGRGQQPIRPDDQSAQ